MMGVMAGGETPRRTVRIPDDLWVAALAKAEAEGVTVSDLLRHLLAEHLASGESSSEARVVLDGRAYIIRPAD